jgi:hypothetical protein
VVGELIRHLQLDAGRVGHELLRVQRPYRGAGLAILLLDRSFAFYQECGLRLVAVHAALETGRWYWARLGFDFETPTERAFVAGWGVLALEALGEPLLPITAPARRWAQLGTASPPRMVSLRELHTAVSAHVKRRLADPHEAATYQNLAVAMRERLGGDWIDHDRFAACAHENGVALDEQIPLGRAIMLTGPDWNGVFDLSSRAVRDAFDEELNRTLKRLAANP